MNILPIIDLYNLFINFMINHHHVLINHKPNSCQEIEYLLKNYYSLFNNPKIDLVIYCCCNKTLIQYYLNPIYYHHSQ